MTGPLPSYVLVTPARNEAAFLEQTIRSVVSQTVLPRRWIIVSDGSTDGTNDIVCKYASEFPWIELVALPERRERHFAGKVHAFNAGYARLADHAYDLIGSLDADLTFGERYFETLLTRFVENPRLGVAGTPFTEDGRHYDYRFSSVEHVSGACQLFRRRCFEEVGGYVPIKSGGVDLVPVLTARMKGWQTRSFPEQVLIHHRKMGTAQHGLMTSLFQGGRTDYTRGGSPVWQIFRCAYQMTRRPFIVAGSLCFAGYFWAMITNEQKVLSDDLVRFRRAEQMHRLRAFIKARFISGDGKRVS